MGSGIFPQERGGFRGQCNHHEDRQEDLFPELDCLQYRPVQRAGAIYEAPERPLREYRTANLSMGKTQNSFS